MLTYYLMDLAALEDDGPQWESRDKGQSGLSVWAWRCHSDESALIAVTLEAFEISVILLITPFSPQPHLPKWPWGH